MWTSILQYNKELFGLQSQLTAEEILKSLKILSDSDERSLKKKKKPHN